MNGIKRLDRARRLWRKAGALALLSALSTQAAGAQTQDWIHQFGTSSLDLVSAAASAPAGSVLLCGSSEGSLGGPSAGAADAWIGRWSTSGSALWLRQLGTLGQDAAGALTSDATSIFAGGSTLGALGGAYKGGLDAWLARYDMNGAQVWVRQLGTTGNEQVQAVVGDGNGGTFAAGYSSGNLGAPGQGSHDAWLARYDSAGTKLWLAQFGTPASEIAYAAAPDGAGGVIVAGYSAGSLGGPSAGGEDFWLARFDALGAQVWVHQFGSHVADIARGAASDGAGGVFLCGETLGSLSGSNAGSLDAWLARFDAAGNQVWLRQLGTPATDRAYAAAADGSGGVYVCGTTRGGLGGAHQGDDDAWIAHYDGAGTLLWSDQLGTNSIDAEPAAASDGQGGLFAAGYTFGALTGLNKGSGDGWVAHYAWTCPSTVTYCSAKVSSNGCVPSMVASGTPSLSAPSSFTAHAVHVEADQNGLLFFGTAGAVANPFLGGTLCVKAPWFRLPVKNSGAATTCEGSLSYSLSELLAQPDGGSLLVAGQVVNAQVWFRDPPASLAVGLSDGLQFSVCP